MLYFFYQETPKTKWIPGLAYRRAEIIREKHPAYVTALDVDNAEVHLLPPEEALQAKYSGPLYWDTDSEDLNTAIQQAQKLLKETAWPITRVASESGFADYNYFCRVFKKETGISARKYRSGS